MPSAPLPGTLSFADKGIAFGFDPDVSPAGLLVPAYMTNNAMHVWVKSKQAGERDENATNGSDFMEVSAACMVQSVAFGAGDTVLNAGPTIVYGYRVTTALSAHAWTIDDAGAVARVTIPLSSPAGIQTLPGPAIFKTSCTVNVGTSASAGVIEFYFRKVPASTVAWAY